MKISPAPFRGLLFSRAEQLKPGEDKRIGGGNSCGNGDLFLAEAEQLPLFCPIRRQPWREADQCLSCELQRLSAVDNGRGDVGRQPGKTQKGIEIGGRHVTLLHGGFASRVLTSRRLRSYYSSEY